MSGAGATFRSIRRWQFRVRVRSEQTAGAIAVIEHRLPPGIVAKPLRRHGREATTLQVLAGVLSVRVADQVSPANAGEIVAVPSATAHTFWNGGETDVRFLETVAPGGLERYYEEVAALAAGTDRPDLNAVLAASQRFGIDVDMDSLLEIMERFHVQLA